MCAILGGNNKKWDFYKGISAMSHRGPDGSRVENFGDVVFAFARLAIVDLSDNGMQPMYTSDRHVAIVFNGEIYGYRKIRKSLEKKYKFSSNTDTEVLLNLYMEYGDNFINKIDGMFAIAIYDMRTNCIKLFRDRAGIKPLYYYEDGKNFAFSSELRGIEKASCGIKFDTNYSALYDYITYSYIPAPKTIYKNVYKLEPACMLEYNLSANKIVKKEYYWELKVNEREWEENNYQEIQEELRRLVNASVKNQMVSDVPVGVMTSGGVDSSIITYESAKYLPSIETFTIGVEDKRLDEIPYAKLLTDYLNLNSNIEMFDIKKLWSLYERMPKWFGEPFADRSAFITYELMKMAKRKVKVLLSGDGGDEIFGGYGWEKSLNKRYMPRSRRISKYYEMWSEKLCRDASLWQHEKIDNIFMDDITWFCKSRWMTLARDKEQYRRKWKIPRDYDDYWHIRKFYHKELPPMTRLQFVDFHTYLPFILQKVDVISMALSLEVRVPLISRKIIEFSFALPQNIRCIHGKPKELLKQSYRMLPQELFYRNKIGFTIPADYFGVGKTPAEIMLKQLWGM